MELYFIRHATAIDRGDPKVHSDAERWLTDEGIAKMQTAAKGFAKIVDGLDYIYTSSYIRAKQTADIIMQVFPKKPKLEETDLLTPGSTEKSIEKLIHKSPPNARIGLVGHEPDFSDIVSMLTSGDLDTSIVMKKGAICRVDVSNVMLPGNGLLVWLVQPKILRMLGKD